MEGDVSSTQKSSTAEFSVIHLKSADHKKVKPYLLESAKAAQSLTEASTLEEGEQEWNLPNPGPPDQEFAVLQQTDDLGNIISDEKIVIVKTVSVRSAMRSDTAGTSAGSSCSDTSQAEQETGPYCGVCGKVFANKFYLKAHMVVHTKERNFKCNICNKSFTQQGNLYIHQRIHTGEKMFVCDVCGKRFSQKGNMKTHRKIHDKVKQFKCKFCDKEFSQKGNLQSHIKIKHDVTNVFPCSECKQKFKTAEFLETHKNVFHLKKEVETCDICHKMFVDSKCLLKHKADKHGIKNIKAE